MEKCDTWSAVNGGDRARGSLDVQHRKHFSQHSKEQQDSCLQGGIVPAQRTQLIEIGAGRTTNSTTHYFIISDPTNGSPETAVATASEAELLTRHNPAASSANTWPHDLGWDQFISAAVANVDHKGAVAKLHKGVARPSIAQVRNAPDEVSKAVEKALLLGDNLNMKYLQEGAQWVTNQHSSIASKFSDKSYVLHSWC